MCDVFEISLKNGFQDIKNYLEYFSNSIPVARLPYDMILSVENGRANVYRILEDGSKSWVGVVNIEIYGIDSAAIRLFKLIYWRRSKIDVFNKCGVAFKLDVVKFILDNSYSDVWVSNDRCSILRASDLDINLIIDIHFDSDKFSIVWNTPLGGDTKSYHLYRLDTLAKCSVVAGADRFMDSLGGGL